MSAKVWYFTPESTKICIKTINSSETKGWNDIKTLIKCNFLKSQGFETDDKKMYFLFMNRDDQEDTEICKTATKVLKKILLP